MDDQGQTTPSVPDETTPNESDEAPVQDSSTQNAASQDLSTAPVDSTIDPPTGQSDASDQQPASSTSLDDKEPQGQSSNESQAQNDASSEPTDQTIPVPSQVSEPVQSAQPTSMPADQAQADQVPQSTPISVDQPAQVNQPDQSGFIRLLLDRANAKIQSNRQKKLDKLVEFVAQNGKITNDGAQKLLRISDKTAERYLNKLVAQEKLRRFGVDKGTYYTS